MKRKDPTLKETLAAAIIQLFDIPREHAKRMSADQIISLIQRDHDPVPFAIARDLGWSPEQYNHPSNIHLKLILAHREKFPRDMAAIAKTDRISPAHAEFQRRVLVAKAGLADDVVTATPRPKSKLRSRGFQRPADGRKQKIQSRGFQKREQR